LLLNVGKASFLVPLVLVSIRPKGTVPKLKSSSRKLLNFKINMHHVMQFCVGVKYSSTSFKPQNNMNVTGHLQALATLLPDNNSGIHSTIGWMGLMASLNTMVAE
jgi:hypothetical protein